MKQIVCTALITFSCTTEQWQIKFVKKTSIVFNNKSFVITIEKYSNKQNEVYVFERNYTASYIEEMISRK